MNYLAIIALAAYCCFAAYNYGQRVGLESAPEYAADQRAERQASEQFWADLMAEPTGQDLVCERIFEMVREELRGDLMPPLPDDAW